MNGISIIVPVYNVEAYLGKCVDSLLAQDISQQEYEIILVDDGSTDRSGEIADEYAAKNKNISVIHQPNAGLSEARNTGMRAAKGEYVMFVDSDDYIEPNVLGGLLKKVRDEELDVLRFNYQNVNEKGEVFNPNKEFKPFVDYRDEVCDGLTFLNERLGTACYVVQFMVRRELVPVFTSGIYFEDVDWTPRMLSGAKRVTSTETMVYNYLQRQGSITKTADVSRKRKVFEDDLLIISRLQEMARHASDRRWFDGMTAGMVIGMLTNVATYLYDERELRLRQIRELGVFPLSDYHLTKSARRKRRIANVSVRLYCMVFHGMRH